MDRQLDLSAVGEIPPGQARGFRLDGLALFVVNRDGEFFAYENRCPHTGVNLEWQPHQFLDIEGRFIQCAVHGALFRIDDGLCLRGPCLGQSLRPLPLALRAGRLCLLATPD